MNNGNGNVAYNQDILLLCENCDTVVGEVNGKAGFYCENCQAFVNSYAPFDKTKYITKDSGERIDYETGARRDTEKDKPRYDLISVHMQRRLAELMARGAEKYGENNWEKGIPISRFYSSALRHLIQATDPTADNSEDHLAAAIFNIQGIIHITEEVKLGRLPQSLIDKEII